jgi:hypothetical protein
MARPVPAGRNASSGSRRMRLCSQLHSQRQAGSRHRSSREGVLAFPKPKSSSNTMTMFGAPVRAFTANRGGAYDGFPLLKVSANVGYGAPDGVAVSDGVVSLHLPVRI